MSIEAKIIEDTMNEQGHRVTTFVLRYPRFIHSEVLTHRVFSRSASSSRAIPINKIIDSIEQEIAAPIHWGANQRGMQASGEVQDENIVKGQKLWSEAAKNAIKVAREMAELGLHKQVVNRILEPFSHISVVLTATCFENFFYLRYSEMAQPEFKALAKKMYSVYKKSEPRPVLSFEDSGVVDMDSPYISLMAHLPFVPVEERSIPFKDALAMSQARCARVSYNNHDGSVNSLYKDKILADSLAKEGHFSPFEHQAISVVGALDELKGNFRQTYDWVQIRKLYPNEHHLTMPELPVEID